MTSLRELQQAFAADLSGEHIRQLRGIVSTDRIPAERRVNIYRNNLRASHRSSLAAIYPVAEKLVGADFFRYMADRYVRVYPSQSGSLQYFGRYLSEFLVDFDPAVTLPYLADVARLEWASHVVLHGPTSEAANLESIPGLAPVEILNLRLEFGSTCRLVHSPFPIFSIWETNQNGYFGDDAVDLNQGSQTVIVARPKSEVELWHLNKTECIFAEILIAGRTLGSAVEALNFSGHDFNLEMLLEKFVRSGAVAFSSKIKTRA